MAEESPADKTPQVEVHVHNEETAPAQEPAPAAPAVLEEVKEEVQEVKQAQLSREDIQQAVAAALREHLGDLPDMIASCGEVLEEMNGGEETNPNGEEETAPLSETTGSGSAPGTPPEDTPALPPGNEPLRVEAKEIVIAEPAAPPSPARGFWAKVLRI